MESATAMLKSINYPVNFTFPRLSFWISVLRIEYDSLNSIEIYRFVPSIITINLPHSFPRSFFASNSLSTRQSQVSCPLFYAKR